MGPLGFTKDGDAAAFKRRRAVELKHGRVSMYACIGYFVPEYAKWPGYLSVGRHQILRRTEWFGRHLQGACLRLAPDRRILRVYREHGLLPGEAEDRIWRGRLHDDGQGRARQLWPGMDW